MAIMRGLPWRIVNWRWGIFSEEAINVKKNPIIAIRRRKVETREHFDGETTMKLDRRYLKYREIMKPRPAAREKMKKPADELRKRNGKFISPPDHPWRRHQPSLHYNSYLERVI